MLMKHVTALLAIGLAPLTALAQNHFAITGVKVDPKADVPLRLNINDLYNKGGPQWEIYIQALKSLQLKDPSDPLSFFQVLGIHGLPYVEWNNGGARRGNGWAGYCPHGENLFLTWHRPFVLLYEQLLVQEATTIASKYPEPYRTQYLAAAKTLRSPYWDWSADSNVPPCTVPTSLTITVPASGGVKKMSVANPLQSYQFPQAAINGRFGQFPRAPKTVRCPSPKSYPQSANQALNTRGLKQNTYDSFITSKTFEEFASTRTEGMGVEEMHNTVHYDAGCQGQFLDARVSAFEPLFMLHHTHVDRLWAYWQYINPAQAVFKNNYYGQSRYSTPQNTLITPDSPLQPFYDAKNTYYTSRKLTSLQGMGYSYAGLDYWKKTPAQLKTSATQLINSLYAASWAVAKRDVPEDKTRYFARVQLDRIEVERPCSVKVFIDGKAAGSVPVLQLPERGILRHSLAVDKYINDAFDGPSPTNGTIESIDHLVEIQIQKVDGTHIPLDSVKSFKVTLEEVTITPAKSDTEFPTMSDKKTHQATVKDHQS